MTETKNTPVPDKGGFENMSRFDLSSPKSRYAKGAAPMWGDPFLCMGQQPWQPLPEVEIML